MSASNFGNIQYKASNGQINLDEAQGIVECFVAGIGNKDSVGDICATGAFAKSLQRRKPRVVWGHNWNDPIGKVLEIYEVPVNDPRLPMKMKMAGIGGLYAKVQFNLQSEKGREAFANVAFFGEEQEWSIGYKTLRAQFDQNLQANVLYEVELYEVSPVLHGANQLTGTISVKSDEEKMHGMMPLVIGAPSAGKPSDEGIFEEGLAQRISGSQLAGVVAELSRRAGGPVMVVDATENSVVFIKPGKGKFRIGYHFTGTEYMFGKPELIQSEQAKPTMQSGPAPMPGISAKPTSENKPAANNPAMPMPVAMKPGDGGMVMVPLPPVKYEGGEEAKKPELVAEERELAESLVRIAGKYGKFDEDGDGIWAGYYPPAENKVKDIGVKCSNCVLYQGNGKCKILDMQVEDEGKCRFAIIPDGVVVGFGKKEYNDILDEDEVKMVEDIEAKYPGEFILGAFRNVVKKRRKKRKSYKTLEEWGIEEQELAEKGLDPFLAHDASYVIPVNPEDAFAVKSILDPVFEYHRIDTVVNEYGIVINSPLDQESKDAIQTAVSSAYGFLKKKLETEIIEEKALGRRIASSAIDRPSIGGRRSRGRGMGIPSGDLDPRTRRDSNLDGTLFDNIPGWEQPDPTPNGPGSINNPKPSRRQLQDTVNDAQKLSSGKRNERRHADRSADMEAKFPNPDEAAKRKLQEDIADQWISQGFGWEEVPRYNADKGKSSDYLRGRELGVNQSRLMWQGDDNRRRPKGFDEKKRSSSDYASWYESYAQSVANYIDANAKEGDDNWNGIEEALKTEVYEKRPDTSTWRREDADRLGEMIDNLGLGINKQRGVRSSLKDREPAPLSSGKKKPKKMPSDKEIYDRRMAGETLQEVADDLGVDRTDVRKAEQRHMAGLRKEGGKVSSGKKYEMQKFNDRDLELIDSEFDRMSEADRDALRKDTEDFITEQYGIDSSDPSFEEIVQNSMDSSMLENISERNYESDQNRLMAQGESDVARAAGAARRRDEQSGTRDRAAGGFSSGRQLTDREEMAAADESLKKFLDDFDGWDDEEWEFDNQLDGAVERWASANEDMPWINTSVEDMIDELSSDESIEGQNKLAFLENLQQSLLDAQYRANSMSDEERSRDRLERSVRRSQRDFDEGIFSSGRKFESVEDFEEANNDFSANGTRDLEPYERVDELKARKDEFESAIAQGNEMLKGLDEDSPEYERLSNAIDDMDSNLSEVENMMEEMVDEKNRLEEAMSDAAVMVGDVEKLRKKLRNIDEPTEEDLQELSFEDAHADFFGLSDDITEVTDEHSMAVDWTVEKQSEIEQALKDGDYDKAKDILYDVTQDMFDTADSVYREAEAEHDDYPFVGDGFGSGRKNVPVLRQWDELSDSDKEDVKRSIDNWRKYGWEDDFKVDVKPLTSDEQYKEILDKNPELHIDYVDPETGATHEDLVSFWENHDVREVVDEVVGSPSDDDLNEVYQSNDWGFEPTGPYGEEPDYEPTENDLIETYYEEQKYAVSVDDMKEIIGREKQGGLSSGALDRRDRYRIDQSLFVDGAGWDASEGYVRSNDITLFDDLSKDEQANVIKKYNIEAPTFIEDLKNRLGEDDEKGIRDAIADAHDEDVSDNVKRIKRNIARSARGLLSEIDKDDRYRSNGIDVNRLEDIYDDFDAGSIFDKAETDRIDEYLDVANELEKTRKRMVNMRDSEKLSSGLGSWEKTDDGERVDAPGIDGMYSIAKGTDSKFYVTRTYDAVREGGQYQMDFEHDSPFDSLAEAKKWVEKDYGSAVNAWNYDMVYGADESDTGFSSGRARGAASVFNVDPVVNTDASRMLGNRDVDDNDGMAFSSGRTRGQRAAARLPKVNATDKEIFERRMEGASLEDVANELGVPRHIVRQAEQRHMARMRGTLDTPVDSTTVQEYKDLEEFARDMAHMAEIEAAQERADELFHARVTAGEAPEDIAKEYGIRIGEVIEGAERHEQFLKDLDKQAEAWAARQDGTLSSGRTSGKFRNPMEGMFNGEHLSSGKQDEVYKAVQDRLVQMLENADPDSWEFPWHKTGFVPNNPTNKKRPYSGVNMLMLLFAQEDKGYGTPMWAGFEQWKKMGGTVRKGEKGTQIFIPTIVPPKKDKDGTVVKEGFTFFKVGYVFNVDQVDGIDVDSLKGEELDPAERVQELEDALAEVGAIVKTGTDGRAFYRPSTDEISMPPFESFKSKEGYYAVLAHEMMHWTGHSSRLNRPNMNMFGDEAYAQEELIAEIAAAFFLAALGVSAEPREDHAKYLKNWLRTLKNDPNALQKAFSEAQKASDFVIGKSPKMQKRLGKVSTEKGVVPGNKDLVPGMPDVPSATLSSGRAKEMLDANGERTNLARILDMPEDDVLGGFKGFERADGSQYFAADSDIFGKNGRWKASKDSKTGKWIISGEIVDDYYGAEDGGISYDDAGVNRSFESPREMAKFIKEYEDERRAFSKAYNDAIASGDMELVGKLLNEDVARIEAERDARFRELAERSAMEQREDMELSWEEISRQFDEETASWSAEDWQDHADDLRMELDREDRLDAERGFGSGRVSRYNDADPSTIPSVKGAAGRDDEIGSNTRHIAKNVYAPSSLYDLEEIRANGNPISFTYKGEKRTIYPTGIKAKKDGGIYFVGVDETSGQYRSFNIEKVEGLVDGADLPVNPRQPGVAKGDGKRVSTQRTSNGLSSGRTRDFEFRPYDGSGQRDLEARRKAQREMLFGVSSGKKKRSASSKRRPMSTEEMQAFRDGQRLRARTIPGKKKSGPDASEFSSGRKHAVVVTPDDISRVRRYFDGRQPVSVGTTASNDMYNPATDDWQVPVAPLLEQLGIQVQRRDPRAQKGSADEMIAVQEDSSVADLAKMLGLSKAEAEKLLEPNASIPRIDMLELLQEIYFPGTINTRLDSEFQAQEDTDKFATMLFGWNAAPYWYDRDGYLLTREEFEGNFEEKLFRDLRPAAIPDDMPDEAFNVGGPRPDSTPDAPLTPRPSSRKAGSYQKQDFTIQQLADFLGVPFTDRKAFAAEIEKRTGGKIKPTLAAMQNWEKGGVPDAYAEAFKKLGIIQSAEEIWGDAGRAFDEAMEKSDYFKRLDELIKAAGVKARDSQMERIHGMGGGTWRKSIARAGKERSVEEAVRIGTMPKYSDTEIGRNLDRVNEELGTNFTLDDIRGATLSSGRRAQRRISRAGAESAEALSSGSRENNGAPDFITPRMQNELMYWARNNKWSSFATSLLEQYERDGFLTARQWEKLLRFVDTQKMKR